MDFAIWVGRWDTLHLEMKFWNGNEYVIVNPVSNNSGWQLFLPAGHPDTYPPQINDILVEALNNQSNNVPSGFTAMPLNNHAGLVTFHSNYLKAHISSTQYSTLSTGPEYDYPNERIIVWGNIGFTVNARDVGINTVPGAPNTSSSGPGLTIKRIEYSIYDVLCNSQTKYIVDFAELLDAESPQIGQLFRQPFFNPEQMPDLYLNGNHDFIELKSIDNTYLHIHRPINQIQSNGIWFTKALNTTLHVFNQTPTQVAIVNELALYSDGEQTLNFRVTDASGQEDPYDLRLIVDNFIPCIRKVEIYKYDNPTTAEYERSWELQGNQYVLEEEPVCSFSDDDDIWVLVYSSEPLKYVDFALNSFNDHNTQSSDTEGTQWLFYVSSDNIIPGDNNLLIDGIDYADNKISGNPAVLSVHQINGTWLPTAVEGPDCFHSFNTDISSGPPTIDFAADNTFPDPAQWVSFTSYSQSGDLSYEWSFEHNSNISVFYGNGYNQNSSDPMVYFTGANDGKITVSLTVINDFGSATETKEDYIQLANSSLNPAYPEFSTVNGLTAISAGHSIGFLDLSLNEPTTWFWQFEGGSPEYSSIQNPEGIYYSEPGFYDVSLTVSNGVGSVLTLKKENFITVYEVLEVLNTDCWVDENIISLGEPVQFSATVFNGIPPYSYTINFNDEHIYSFTTDNVIITTDPYFFTSSGNKTISVGITDAGSPPKIGSCYQGISVSQTGPIHTVDFTWNPPNPLLSQDISFQNLSTVPAGMSLNNSYWQWFADPITGNEPVYPSPVPYSELLYNVNAMNNPSTHAKYDELGSYPVTLTVSDQYGWQVMKTKYINFNANDEDCIYFRNRYYLGQEEGVYIDPMPFAPDDEWINFYANTSCCLNNCNAPADFYKWVTDIRWKIFDASTGAFILNSEQYNRSPYTCYQNSQGYGEEWYQQHDHTGYFDIVEKGDYLVQCEVWNGCIDDEVYTYANLQPAMAQQLPYYDVATRLFKVVDCDEIINFSLIVNNGNMEIWGGTINLSSIVVSGSGLSCVGHEEINMLNGFNALNGCDFLAKIIPCPDCKDSINRIPERFADNGFENNTPLINSINFELNQGFNVYPNPATGIINIILDNCADELICIELRQISGQMIINEQQEYKDKIILDLSLFPKGIYLLTLKTSNKLFNKKIVLQ